MALHAVDADKPNPIMAMETRPSAITGFAWFMVLTYKEHHFEEMLPQEFGGLDEVGQNFFALRAAGRLKAKLRPILLREDEDDAHADHV